MERVQAATGCVEPRVDLHGDRATDPHQLRMESDIDVIEEQIFSPRSTAEIDQIYLLKREIVELRRAVGFGRQS